MLRSRGNRLPSERAARCLALLSFSFYRGGRRACRLSLYRSGRAAPVASPSVVFGRPRGLSFYRAPLVPRGPPILLLSLSLSSSSLASARKRIGLERDSLLLSLSLSDISSPDRLYRPVDFSSVFRDRASRWSSSAIAATGAHAHIRAEAHCSRREPRLFSNARPRFLADFIPIPRNKLADDHGGICLLGIYSLPRSPFCS